MDTEQREEIKANKKQDAELNETTILNSLILTDLILESKQTKILKIKNCLYRFRTLNCAGLVQLDEKEGQLSPIMCARDLQTLKTILDDYETCGEFTSEFYAWLYGLCDQKESDDEILKIMFSCKRFNVNKTQNGNGETILHALVRNNHYNWIKYLLLTFSNVDLNIASKKMKTPIILAAEYGYMEILDLLEQNGADIYCCDKKKNTLLHLVCKQGNLKWVKYLIEEKSFKVNLKNDYGDTPINRAISFGHYNCSEYLLKIGANILEADIDKRTILHSAVHGGNPKCFNLMLEQIIKTDKSFINFKDTDGKSALNWAAGKGHKEMVISLLNASADVNDKDNEGKTALIWASLGGHEDIVKLLIKAKANTDEGKKDKALTWAASQGHIGIVKILIEAGANVNITDATGNTALNWSIQKGHDTLVDYLLRNEKINVNCTPRPFTPLMWAAKKNNVNVLRSLIRAKANIDHQNNRGETALIIAAASGNLKCVVELIRNNANIDLEDKTKETALMKAMKLLDAEQNNTRYKNIIRILKYPEAVM